MTDVHKWLDILWRNMTFFNHSSLFILVRQLEYSLLQLTLEVDELKLSIQLTFSGKLPITIIGPNVLHNILKNISLYSPDSYELIAGNKIDNIRVYYESIKVNVVGTMHDIKWILEIPLKTTRQYFTLCKIIALPTRIFNDTFAIYTLDWLFRVGT